MALNPQMVKLADALARAFDYIILRPKRNFEEGADKEVLMVKATDLPKIKIPADPKSQDFKDLAEALKHRHKLEAWTHSASKEPGLLVCEYGYMSGAPQITDEEVNQVIKAHKEREEDTSVIYEDLMDRLTKQGK